MSSSIPDHALYTHIWLRKLQRMYAVPSTRNVCSNDNARILNACKNSQAFKFSQVLRFLEIINATKNSQDVMNVLKTMFGSIVVWENFVASRGVLMEVYVKQCVCYRDFLNCSTGRPFIKNLPRATTFAAATSAIGDAGISLSLLELLKGLTELGSDHRLVIIIIIAMYQQLFLDYENSYLQGYSTYFPIDPLRNPAFLSTSIGDGEKIINAFVPNYLWYLLAHDLYTLELRGIDRSTANDNRLWHEYLNVVNVPNVRSALYHLGTQRPRACGKKRKQLLETLARQLCVRPFDKYRDSRNYLGRVAKVIRQTNAMPGNSPRTVQNDLADILSSKAVMSAFRAVLETIVGPGVPDVHLGVTREQVRAYTDNVNSKVVCY